MSYAEDSGNEDDSVFVSYTDLMIGFLFVFIIMLMLFVRELNQQKAVFEHKTNEAEQKTKEATSASQLLQDAVSARTEMLDRISTELAKVGIKVIVDHESGSLRLPEELLFAKGQATFSKDGESKIALLASTLESIMPCYTEVSLVGCQRKTRGVLETALFEGHTDNDPIKPGGAYKDNWDLSAQRSINVYKRLVSLSPILARIENQSSLPVLGVSGYGETRPVENNTNKDDKEKSENRRIEFRIIMAPLLGPQNLDNASNRIL